MQGLIVDTRDGRRRTFRWSHGTVKFGSGVDADLVLGADGIAERHGTFTLDAKGCHVAVEPAAAPIELNGSATRDAPIRIGDVVRIGPFQLAFAESAAPAPKPAFAPAPAPAPVAAEPAMAAAGAGAVPFRRKSQDSARMRMKMAGQGINSDGMKTVAIITGLIAVGVIVFFFGPGSPWKDMGDNITAKKSNAIVLMKNCDFAGAEAKVTEIEQLTDDPDVKADLVKLRSQIATEKAAYAIGKQELAELRGKADATSIDNFQRLIFYFQNKYLRFEPLCKDADDLLAQAKAGTVRASTTQPEDTRDFSAHGAAPGFTNRKGNGGNQ